MKELKDALKEKNLVFGTERTIKGIRSGEVKKVFIAKNCPGNARKKIKYYAGIDKIDVFELDANNEELGVMCKKPFSIAVLSC